MIIQNKIFLRRKRDFGDTFSTVFTLLRQNFAVIFGSVLVVAGPFLLLTGVFSALMQSSIMGDVFSVRSLMRGTSPSQMMSDMLSHNLLYMVLLMLFSLLSVSFLRSTMASFFVIYDQKAAGENISVHEVSRMAYREGLRVFGGLIVFTLLSIIPMAIIILPFVLLGMVGSGAGAVIAVLLFLLIFLAFGPQFAYIFQFGTWFVMVRDRVFLFEAVGRLFKTIKGNFWWIWVYMVCIFFVYMIIAWVVSIPGALISQFTMMSRLNDGNADVSITFIIATAITQLLAQMIQVLGDLMVGVTYYSFEEEQTGVGLTSRIDEIGKQDTNENYL